MQDSLTSIRFKPFWTRTQKTTDIMQANGYLEYSKIRLYLANALTIPMGDDEYMVKYSVISQFFVPPLRNLLISQLFLPPTISVKRNHGYMEQRCFAMENLQDPHDSDDLVVLKILMNSWF